VTELAELVLRLTGADSPIEYHPLPVDDPARRRPVIAQAQQVLGWNPVVSAEDGLARTVQYFRERPGEVFAARDALLGGQLDGAVVLAQRAAAGVVTAA
jgi:dTDP-glucose 4,6-dehydratase